jgi:hypothetical protein
MSANIIKIDTIEHRHEGRRECMPIPNYHVSQVGNVKVLHLLAY